jgi:hypothetical protein
MKLHCSTRISGVLAALLLASVAFPAAAHHSAAPFDMAKQLTLEGTVEKWVWANPHSWLYMQVAKADGSQEVWGIEAGSTGMLARSGWGAYDMKPGDKISITYSPEREGKHIGLLWNVKLPNGRMLTAGAGAPPGTYPPQGAGAPPPGAGAPPPGAAPVAPSTR